MYYKIYRIASHSGEVDQICSDSSIGRIDDHTYRLLSRTSKDKFLIIIKRTDDNSCYGSPCYGIERE